MAYPIYLLQCECPAIINELLLIEVKVHEYNCPLQEWILEAEEQKPSEKTKSLTVEVL